MIPEDPIELKRLLVREFEAACLVAPTTTAELFSQVFLATTVR